MPPDLPDRPIDPPTEYPCRYVGLEGCQGCIYIGKPECPLTDEEDGNEDR